MHNKEDILIKDLLLEEMVKELLEQRELLRNDAKKNIETLQSENRKTYNRSRKKASLYKEVSPHIFMWSAAVDVVLAQYHSTILEVLEEQREQFPHHVKAPLRHPEGSTGKHCVSQAWHDSEMTIER
ncbi:hypothetical protein TNCV_4087481 [Trichonephila clavipes]|uniref:Uncharacterized protein n=1 Tax=Trichonephila clavipes TaxID=2585209 RepID=A0A8X6V2X3_TRICX|nr:hypothetical protein TNCV_4087481 [Trichonephila clavipes]